MFQISVLSLTALMFFAGCGKRSVEYSVNPVPGANATRVAKYRFEIFRNAPEARPYVKIAEVTAETTNIEKAKDIFTKQGKKVKGQAAVNIRAVKVGNYRGLSVHHWVADIVVWQ
ncbi:MAG: hypothetical protein O3C43_08630 [Verrucomicrobia bacterium]|nr:hypothetical protein [Verrucomicrobiota bacterium]MDA1066552.1 hypothetical protein [Verrucomicrobiota bacterium]